MPSNIGVNFNGRHIIQPSAAAMVNANALNTVGSVAQKKIALIGSSDGGQPQTVLTFSNPADAAAVLKGGDLLKAATLAWAPSGDGVGAGDISFIRVENALQSSLVQGSMTLTSLDWGANNNNIQAKLEAGTAANSRKLTIYNWQTNVTEVYDNVGPIFTVQYTGVGVGTPAATATMTIITDSTSGLATSLSISLAGTVAMTYTLGNGQWQDVNAIVADINNHAGFSAAMVTYGNKNINSNQLDAVVSQDIKAAVYTVTALKGDTVYQTRFSQLAKVTFTATGTYPTNFPYTYFSGGSNGTSPASWANLVDKFYGEGVYLITPLTSDDAIQAEVQTFVENQSTYERSEMIGIYGGALGMTVDDAVAQALTFNSSRAVVAFPGITRAVAEGDTETLAPYFTAAMIAGRIAGKDVGDPITLDYLNLIGLETTLKSNDVDRLIQAGVTAIEFVLTSGTKGYRIAQGVTTYQSDSNPNYREISMRMVSDELSAELVEMLEDKFAGGKGTVSSIALIKNQTQSWLDQKKAQQIIVDYDPNSVTVVLNGDVVSVNYACIPVGAINYILITATYYQQQIIG